MNHLATTCHVLTCSRCGKREAIALDAEDRDMLQLLRKCRKCAEVDVECSVFVALRDERPAPQPVPVVHHPVRNVALVIIGVVAAVAMACVWYGFKNGGVR